MFHLFAPRPIWTVFGRKIVPETRRDSVKTKNIVTGTWRTRQAEFARIEEMYFRGNPHAAGPNNKRSVVIVTGKLFDDRGVVESRAWVIYVVVYSQFVPFKDSNPRTTRDLYCNTCALLYALIAAMTLLQYNTTIVRYVCYLWWRGWI